MNDFPHHALCRCRACNEAAQRGLPSPASQPSGLFAAAARQMDKIAYQHAGLLMPQPNCGCRSCATLRSKRLWGDPPVTFHGVPVVAQRGLPSLAQKPLLPAADHALPKCDGCGVTHDEPRGLAAWLPVEPPRLPDPYAGIDRFAYRPVIIPKGALDVRKALEDAWERLDGELGPIQAMPPGPYDFGRKELAEAHGSLCGCGACEKAWREAGDGIAKLPKRPPAKALDMSTWADDFDLLEDA